MALKYQVDEHGRRYIYDIHTPNISFIQTSVDLKRLGIKNHMFFLKLYDPSLRGVDPHSPTLNNDQIIRIINECIINPWYYLRECARIPTQGNTLGVPYLLNRANLASTWCFINGIDNYLVIPRQIGKTESTVSILTWAFLLGTTNSEFMFLNLNEERSIANLAKLKDQRDLLPKYLQFKIAFDEDMQEIKGRDNIKTLKNATNGNSIVTKPSASSIAKAETIGRGASQPIQYYDEFEFINFIKTIMEAAGPAFNTASENAKKNHAMYGRIITSTPGDLDTRAGMDALEVIENTCRFSESLYDKPIDEVRDYVDANSGNKILYIEYQYQQLGKDEAWFNRVCALVNNNKLKIQREIFLKRMHGSSLSPYDLEDLQAIQELKGNIVEEIFINKVFKLDVYTKLKKDKIYFVGVDVAGGYGSDNSAITVWDPYTLKTVAEFKSPYISVKSLIQFIYVLIKKYLPRSILAIERNYNGEAVLDHLRDTDILGNIYFDNTKTAVKIDDKFNSKGFLEEEAQNRRFYGIYTKAESRERMFGLLETFVKEHKDSFVSANVIDDLMKLVRTRTGKIEAQTGFHDDSIMSFLMCLYLYYFGNNLSRYGFIRGVVDEEELNQGMHYDANAVYGYLNENEKAALGITDETISMENDYNNLDITKMIQDNANKGFISTQELHKALADMDASETPDNGPRRNPLQQMDPYQLKVFNEMQQAQRESEAFNQRLNLGSSYRNMDDDYSEFNDGFDDGLFTELND